MNVVDVGLILLLFFSALRGYSKGFFHEMLSLISILVGCAAAFRWAPAIADAIAARASMPYFLTISLAFLTVFFPIMFATRLGNTMMERLWPSIGGMRQNRTAGLWFGAAKGAVLLGCTVLLLRSSVPVNETQEAFAGKFAGVAQELRVRMQDSFVADSLARMTLGIFSVAMDKGGGYFLAAENFDRHR